LLFQGEIYTTVRGIGSLWMRKSFSSIKQNTSLAGLDPDEEQAVAGR